MEFGVFEQAFDQAGFVERGHIKMADTFGIHMPQHVRAWIALNGIQDAAGEKVDELFSLRTDGVGEHALHWRLRFEALGNFVNGPEHIFRRCKCLGFCAAGQRSVWFHLFLIPPLSAAICFSTSQPLLISTHFFFYDA